MDKVLSLQYIVEQSARAVFNSISTNVVVNAEHYYYFFKISQPRKEINVGDIIELSKIMFATKRMNRE